MKSAQRRLILAIFASATLAACSGIPLTSLSRLVSLPDELLHLDPAELVLAIQTDRRVVPPAGAVPQLLVQIHPRVAGGFEPVDRELPLVYSGGGAPVGLPRAGGDRRWMVYRFSPEAQAELVRLQAQFQKARSQGQGSPGATFGVGIEQEGVAPDDPRLAATRWESWLRTSSKTGFFELWSGTLGNLVDRARAERAKLTAHTAP